MIITFVGHSTMSSSSKVVELVQEQIKKCILNNKSITCYVGGYGMFDALCALACRELKKEYDKIEIVYVTPYLSSSEHAKIKEMQKSGFCDTSIYPPIEKTPPRYAILKRNEWMVTNSDLIIAYVNRGYGGAYKAIQIAKRKKKTIINICDIIQN